MNNRLQESANYTALKLIKESTNPAKPALKESVRKQVVKETHKDKKSIQQVQDQLENERAKRLKLDKRVQFLEGQLQLNKSKEQSGPTRGALPKIQKQRRLETGLK